jgi:hypothetical protein
VRVIFYLPPFHPLTYEKMVGYFPMVPEVERYLRGFAAGKGIAVIGSFNPAVSGFTSLDFFDGSHGHGSVPERLFAGFR